jgi:multidrug efflux pump subunit AcrA (membrane-fusion protein)
MAGKIVFIILLLLAIGGGYYYYEHEYLPAHAETPAPDMSKMVMPVDVAKAIARDVQLWHEYSGRLAAVDNVEIRARVSGPIETVDFRDGTMVKKRRPAIHD